MFVSESNRIRLLLSNACNLGAYGFPSCHLCSPGTYSDVLNSTKCNNCPLGTYSSVNGAESISSCAKCSLGMFANISGASQCFPCSAGTFSSIEGAIECNACKIGTYSSINGSTSSEFCFPCTPGTYSPNEKASHCLLCPSDTFSTVIGATSIDSCKSCSWIYETGQASCTIGVKFALVTSGSILGGTILVIMFIGCCIFFCRKIAQYYKQQSLKQSLSFLEVTTKSDTTVPFALDYSLFDIQFEEMTELQEIGNGGSGAVILKALWKKQWVVVKLFLLSNISDNESFEHELQLCTSLRSKNVVFFYGACLRLPRVGIVLEYCSNGTLKQYLSKNSVSWKKKYDLTIEIVQGLAFLHAQKCIHRDMKSDNVLIDDDLHAKITDFGISTVGRNELHTMQIGTSWYMAPEVSQGNPYNEKCDMYSFSIIMYEIMTQNFKPYGKNAQFQHIELQVAKNHKFRPQIPVEFECDASHLLYIECMKKCWHHDATQRPSAAQVAEMLLANYSLLYQV